MSSKVCGVKIHVLIGMTEHKVFYLANCYSNNYCKCGVKSYLSNNLLFKTYLGRYMTDIYHVLNQCTRHCIDCTKVIYVFQTHLWYYSRYRTNYFNSNLMKLTNSIRGKGRPKSLTN